MISISIDLMLIITPLESDTRTLITTNTVRLGGNGLERNRRPWLPHVSVPDRHPVGPGPVGIVPGPCRPPSKIADIFEKQTTILSLTWSIYGIQYVKVGIRTNKPPNGHFRFRLSCRLRYRYRHQTRLINVSQRFNRTGKLRCENIIDL